MIGVQLQVIQTRARQVDRPGDQGRINGDTRALRKCQIAWQPCQKGPTASRTADIWRAFQYLRCAVLPCRCLSGGLFCLRSAFGFDLRLNEKILPSQKNGHRQDGGEQEIPIL